MTTVQRFPATPRTTQSTIRTKPSPKHVAPQFGMQNEQDPAPSNAAYRYAPQGTYGSPPPNNNMHQTLVPFEQTRHDEAVGVTPFYQGHSSEIAPYHDRRDAASESGDSVEEYTVERDASPPRRGKETALHPRRKKEHSMGDRALIAIGGLSIAAEEKFKKHKAEIKADPLAYLNTFNPLSSGSSKNKHSSRHSIEGNDDRSLRKRELPRHRTMPILSRDLTVPIPGSREGVTIARTLAEDFANADLRFALPVQVENTINTWEQRTGIAREGLQRQVRSALQTAYSSTSHHVSRRTTL